MDTPTENNDYTGLPSENPPFGNSPYKLTNLLKRFFYIILAFLTYDFICRLSDSSPFPPGFFPLSYQDLIPKRPEKLHFSFDLDQITDLSIQLSREKIQASFSQEQIFPMQVSLKTQEFELPFQPSVDLIIVFEYAKSLEGEMRESIQQALKQLLPLMRNQDRLSIIHPSDVVLSDYPYLLASILPLASTTTQYKEKILSLVGQKPFREYGFLNKGLEAAVNVLNKRTEANQVTGIFLVGDRYEEYDETRRRDLGGVSIQTIPVHLDTMGQTFVEKLSELRASLVESSKFFIKPEQSEVFQGVEIVKSYFYPQPEGTKIIFIDSVIDPEKEEELEPQELSFMRSPFLLSGKEENFVFDLKIPRMSQPLPSSPMEVKVASCKVVLTMWNGDQVVKNADLIVKIAKEEEIVNDGDNEEIMRNYYRKKGSLFMERVMAWVCFFEEFKAEWEGYKKSVESSVVKDDEVIQRIRKITEERIREAEAEEAYLNCPDY